MQLANSWRRMVWVVLSVPFVVYFALDTAKPGRGASDAELATIRATAVIRGQCENGANCMYLTSQPPDVVNGMCIDNGSDGACGTTEGKYCGSCTGAADQVCTANPSSPYFCDDALPNGLSSGLIVPAPERLPHRSLRSLVSGADGVMTCP